ncbi:MAG: carboxylating nicotinate-nucleotide diphosphorylase [Xanthomonadales bacterium]|nr:carboxylating nicotinate-nucleotide diphosphorylase [Xanthomonadales bacterium]NIN59099.1 carboxylating nicotinate-nucleotide diphosphorylase [Xanthomonadales bacterium]NIN74410.1 carboxylating nicotinate-nucleotide diphosphorylase [Xanthomonadales bacterium]NIO13213.1 carboxylating nicotinate-nucleotide diphosphorylase [Xanthomonadales bacterium]NIP11492.1 carboxylating nicotinate-nucleotide diphosphorylase [Xanthomonadales bacterium]
MPGQPRLPGDEEIAAQVARALAEDIGDGDCTAGLIPAAAQLTTRVICRQAAVLCGVAWFQEAYRQLDPSVSVSWSAGDGDPLQPGQAVCRVRGPARAVLSGERTALNFLQTLSATATRAARYLAAIQGTQARILDTRKTVPGLRAAQKYAVRCGGADNHRMGLFDAILIKENHIAAAGSIAAAVSAARAQHPDLPLEVEVEGLAQIGEACAVGVERVLLDNFSLADLRAAVQRYGDHIELEASGQIDLERVRAVAETGVDFISVGDLTKSLEAVDFSMRFTAPSTDRD